VRVGGSHELLELLASDRLDVVLGMGQADDLAAIRTAPMQWLGEAALAEQDVLPLAILEVPCRFRDAALRALDGAGRAYRVCWRHEPVGAARAIDSGLAVTCRTDVFSRRSIEAILCLRFRRFPTSAIPGPIRTGRSPAWRSDHRRVLDSSAPGPETMSQLPCALTDASSWPA